MNSSQEYTTTIIAVYGAIIATFGFVLSLVLGINELRRHSPRVKVNAVFGCFYDKDGKRSEELIVFNAHNTGEVPVIITGVGWLTHNNSKHQFLHPYLLALPYKLEPHRKISTYYACRWY